MFNKMSLSQLKFSNKLFPISFTAPTNKIIIKAQQNTLKLGLLKLLSVLRVFFIMREQEKLMSGEKWL